VTIDLHRDRLAELCRRYGIAELSVFGSVARGDDRPGSDVDLLYVLAPTARLGWEIVDLKDDLEEVLGRPVDLVPRSGLKRLVRDRVLAEAEVVYAA
jgi:predicted nucleotidyltransferase